MCERQRFIIPHFPFFGVRLIRLLDLSSWNSLEPLLEKIASNPHILWYKVEVADMFIQTCQVTSCFHWERMENRINCIIHGGSQQDPKKGGANKKIKPRKDIQNLFDIRNKLHNEHIIVGNDERGIQINWQDMSFKISYRYKPVNYAAAFHQDLAAHWGQKLRYISHFLLVSSKISGLGKNEGKVLFWLQFLNGHVFKMLMMRFFLNCKFNPLVASFVSMVLSLNIEVYQVFYYLPFKIQWVASRTIHRLKMILWQNL